MDRRQARAFDEFVADSGDSLLRLAVMLTGDHHLAEDLYQQTLERLATRWSRVSNPKAFCRRVLHNLVVDEARLRSRQPRETVLLQHHDDSDPRFADPLSAVETRPALFAALETLTILQRSVVVLRFLDDRSEAEVAALLGISTGTVKSTTSRAMAHLREHPSLIEIFRPAPTLQT